MSALHGGGRLLCDFSERGKPPALLDNLELSLDEESIVVTVDVADDSV